MRESRAESRVEKYFQERSPAVIEQIGAWFKEAFETVDYLMEVYGDD